MTTKHLSINTVYVVKPEDMRVENIVNYPSRSLAHRYRRPKCPEIQDERTIREMIEPDKAVILPPAGEMSTPFLALSRRCAGRYGGCKGPAGSKRLTLVYNLEDRERDIRSMDCLRGPYGGV